MRGGTAVVLTEPAVERIVSMLSKRGIQAIVFYPRPPGLAPASDGVNDRPPAGNPASN
jgi:hypothetical protein